MKRQHDHQVLSSLALFLDNRILTSGEAFFNHQSRFYPATSQYSNRRTYSLPFKQLVNDSSVSGATVMTSIQISGIPVTVGSSGLLSINHYQGTVDFDTSYPNYPAPSMSGSFAVKEINIYTTTDNDEKLLFYTKFQRNPQTPQTITGLATSAYTLPAIFLKKRGGENKPFSLGSVDESIIDIRAFVITDNDYLRDGAVSILKDTHYRRFSFIVPPFDAEQAYVGVDYSYSGLSAAASGTYFGPLIQEVRESRLSKNSSDGSSDDLKITVVDFEISQVRSH